MKRNLLKNSVYLCMALVVAVLFSACEDKNYYDPNFKTENPIDGIQAPDGFDWKTMRTVPVSVQVNDEMLGEYYYVVEVFDQNPLTNEEALPLTRGYANKDQDFSTEIVIAPGIELVYIQQTDPRGRARVQMASTDADINCVFTS